MLNQPISTMNTSDHPAAPEIASKRIIRKAELADKLQVSVRTIDNWMASGIIPFIKINRVRLFDLERVMASLERFEHKALR